MQKHHCEKLVSKFSVLCASSTSTQVQSSLQVQWNKPLWVWVHQILPRPGTPPILGRHSPKASNLSFLLFFRGCFFEFGWNLYIGLSVIHVVFMVQPQSLIKTKIIKILTKLSRKAASAKVGWTGYSPSSSESGPGDSGGQNSSSKSSKFSASLAFIVLY